MGSREDAIHHAVASLYRAACSPQSWPAALEEVGDVLGHVGFITSVITDRDIPFIATTRLDPHRTAILAKNYSSGTTNCLLAAVPRLPVGRAVAREQVAPDEVYFRSGLYHDVFRPLRLRHVAVGSLVNEPGLLMPFGVVRADRRDDLSGDDMRLLELFVMHMQNAAQIMLRTNGLDASRTAAEQALDYLPLGILLVSGTCRVLRANRAAQQILAANDGLDVRQGEVKAARPDETRRLQQLVARCAATGSGKGLAGGGALRLSRPSLAPPLTVMVTPIRADHLVKDDARPAAAMFISDPERAAAPTAQVLHEAFGLSRAECALLSRLVQGRDLQEAAADIGVAVSTARTHLAHIFTKLGTSRQADLIRRVANSAAWIDLGQEEADARASRVGRDVLRPARRRRDA